MKKIISGFLGIWLMVCVFNAQAEEVSFSSVAFKSVDYSIATTNSLVFFKDAIIKERLRDISVNVDLVEVLLQEDSKAYTTLELISVQREDWNWLTVKKVIVVVRHKDDFFAWQKFLAEIKRLQERERKRMLEPVRVLPPSRLDH